MRALLVVLLLLRALPVFAAPPVGQWIWTERDRRLFAESQKALPELRAAPWVSTLTVEGGALAQRLAQAPVVAGAPARVLVVRFDDGVVALFDRLDDVTLAAHPAEEGEVAPCRGAATRRAPGCPP